MSQWSNFLIFHLYFLSSPAPVVSRLFCDFVSDWYSLHINCGGREVSVDGITKYEADTDSGGSSRFFQSGTNWASSSTGQWSLLG